MTIVYIIAVIIICFIIGYFGDKRLRSKQNKDNKNLDSKTSNLNNQINNNENNVNNEESDKIKIEELNADYTVAPSFDSFVDLNANNNLNSLPNQNEYNGMANPGVMYQNQVQNNITNTSFNQDVNSQISSNSLINPNINQEQNNNFVQNQNTVEQPMLGQNTNFYGSNGNNPMNINSNNMNNGNPIAEDEINNMF